MSEKMTEEREKAIRSIAGSAGPLHPEAFKTHRALNDILNALDAERKAHEETRLIDFSEQARLIDRTENAEAELEMVGAREVLSTLRDVKAERDQLKARVEELEKNNDILTSYAEQLSKRMRT